MFCFVIGCFSIFCFVIGCFRIFLCDWLFQHFLLGDWLHQNRLVRRLKGRVRFYWMNCLCLSVCLRCLSPLSVCLYLSVCLSANAERAMAYRERDNRAHRIVGSQRSPRAHHSLPQSSISFHCFPSPLEKSKGTFEEERDILVCQFNFVFLHI